MNLQYLTAPRIVTRFNYLRTLALGDFGIVAGLSLYGHKIVTAVSVKISKITPSPGFSIEIGVALVMITGTMLGVPLSSTHCQVGATSGVALLEVRERAAAFPLVSAPLPARTLEMNWCSTELSIHLAI